MKTACAFHLPGEARTAARRSLGIDPSDVVVVIGPLPAALGARAVACGRHVVLEPAVGRLPAGEIARVLGHELAHLAQQRRGRVAAQGALAGLVVNASRELEEEADELGRRFARGEAAACRPVAGAVGRGPAVAQRLVSIGGRGVARPSELPPEVASVVSMIQGATRWLEWAAADPIDAYPFEDAGSLVAGIQDGLHGSPWTLLPRLGVLVSPVRLLELAADDLAALATYESKESNGVASDRQVKKILSEHDLVGQDELTVGLDFLDEMGLRSDAVFQSLGLADQIDLFRLVDGARTETWLDRSSQKEASGFAVHNAQQPQEFIDYYRLYMAFLERGLGGKTKASRLTPAQEMVDGLGGRLYSQLRCPIVERAPSPGELAELLGRWVPQTGSLAFPRLSAAVSQVFRGAGPTSASGTETQAAVDGYLQRARAVLCEAAPDAPSVAQDGGSRRYPIDAADGSAVVSWSPSGQLTLESIVAEETAAADEDADEAGDMDDTDGTGEGSGDEAEG